MEEKKLRRSRNEKLIAGVCGGLAKYFGLDVVLVRIAYILLSVFTAFAGVLVYLILMMVMPQEKFSDTL
ncbi:MAG: PspC domain-containing protein [Muribaculaceae bacterium]|nr:PspC domain-containing protein [Muribaculaceae bacterium]